ncbi:hypothetical protein RINTHM_5300 [Richelia intracellularis HM01]|uniref:hypothetical protein n=1 Tax=Richelia intracellularis TaxID=1164990 RepID=UPI0002B560F9|nr:hypothetical protein [Richelia intracellularis]CCH64997.1 hypothetical protein RINTHM_5300 [Richelia intracellularis HM01]
MLRINLLVWALVFYDQNKQSNYKDRAADGVILDISMVLDIGSRNARRGYKCY